MAVLITVFVWWFSTGAIFWAVSRGAGLAEVVLTSPLAAIAGYVLFTSAWEGGATAAFSGFIAAIVIWGWFELSFLTGVLTGPNRRFCPIGVTGWRHFLMAWGTLAHHEIALLLTAVGLGVLTWHAPDHTGLWTFLILFFARISAKLNVYFGVPNLSHEMMPDAIAHMKSYFADRRMNWLFPLSITALTFALACWVERAYAVPVERETGFVLLAALTGLALIEHWLMVLPIRDAVLWQWLRQTKPLEDHAVVKPTE